MHGHSFWTLISATAITCLPLSNLTNGSVSYSNVPGQNNSYKFNVKATYSCNSGFALVGNKTRDCSGDGNSTTGNFDGMAPTCKGIIILYFRMHVFESWDIFAAITCYPLADLTNGTVTYSAAADGVGNYVFNVTANHSCDFGFDLFGNSARTCTGDGSIITGAFDGDTPRCGGECAQIMVRDNSELL